MKRKTKNNTSSSQSIATTKTSNASDSALISVLENLPIGVVVFTLNKILFLNKTALKIFKPNKELKKTIHNHSIFEFLLPEYHKRIKENSVKILKGEEVKEEIKKKAENNKDKADNKIKGNWILFFKYW